MKKLLIFASLAALGIGLALAASRLPAQDSGKAAPAGKAWSGAATFRKPSDEQLKKLLTPLQYQVTQHAATERAFANEYWDEKRPGIYVDIVSGEPLFSSKEKFDSGTGWPSFWKPLEPANIKTGSSLSGLGMWAEVRSAHADSHLGHVFDDGPKPTGLRYCMNSAAMRFILAGDLETQGYGEYVALFRATR